MDDAIEGPSWAVTMASRVLLFLFIVTPLLGYWFMYVDFRAYLRALNRALVVISHAPRYVIPDWARRHDPVYFRALGLDATCSEEEIKQAYRRLAERLHPDRGGDPRRFQTLRSHMEDALAHVQERSNNR
jgi:DnaJ domain